MFLKLLFVVFLSIDHCFTIDPISYPRFEVREESPYEETTDIRFLYQCVDQHNEYRRSNGSSLLLVFNRDVENQARRRVTKMALNGKLLPPDPNSPYEETSAWTPSTVPVDCREIVDHWFYDSHPFFPAPLAKKKDGTVTKKSMNPLVADFIWRRATELGCAQALVHEPQQGVITVCNYYSSKFRVNKKFVPDQEIRY